MYKLYFGVDCDGNKTYSKDVYQTEEEANKVITSIKKESPNILVEVVKVAKSRKA